jgi:hypothetical protein
LSEPIFSEHNRFRALVTIPISEMTTPFHPARHPAPLKRKRCDAGRAAQSDCICHAQATAPGVQPAPSCSKDFL